MRRGVRGQDRDVGVGVGGDGRSPLRVRGHGGGYLADGVFDKVGRGAWSWRAYPSDGVLDKGGQGAYPSDGIKRDTIYSTIMISIK